MCLYFFDLTNFRPLEQKSVTLFRLLFRGIPSEIFWPLGNHVQKLMILLKETSEAFCNFFDTVRHCKTWACNLCSMGPKHFWIHIELFLQSLMISRRLKSSRAILKKFFNPLLVPVLSVTSWEKKVTLVLAPDFLSCMLAVAQWRRRH